MARRLLPCLPAPALAVLFAMGATLAFANPALAQDDEDDESTWDLDEDDFDPDETDDDATDGDEFDIEVERVKEDDEMLGDPDDDLILIQPDAEESDVDFELDEFEDDAEIAVVQPGQDTSKIYRDQLERVEDMGPDEESLAWEKYLRKYPNSLYTSRIQTRMDELSELMYDERIDGGDSERFQDAGKAEIKFAQTMTLENIDPRSNIRAGFEWGFPSFISLTAVGEYQIRREWSAVVGIRGRYTGFNFEAGTRYALVKSSRLELLVTGLLDAHINLNPVYYGIRPQVGVGKRWHVSSVAIDTQLQAGSDVAFISGTTSPRLVGGANITVIPNKTVRAFVETSTYMKDFGVDQIGTFRFNTFTFGLKFITRSGANTEKFETGVGASAPYTANYWQYHFGSIQADTRYYY